METFSVAAFLLEFTHVQPGTAVPSIWILVKITIGDKDFEVPDGNMLLRAMQYLSPEDVSYGKFCWNEECQYCRVNFDLGPETPVRTAISCKLMVQNGMRVTEVAQEIKYCLRSLGVPLKLREQKP